MKNRKLSQEEINYLVENCHKFWKTHFMKKFNITYKHICEIEEKLNLTPRKHHNFEEELIKDYLNKESFNDILKKYKVSWCGMRKILKKDNIPEREKIIPKRTHVLDENYFEKIDTEAKAYFLGFLYADGCVLKRNGRKDSYVMCISLQEKDKHILESFKRELSCSQQIKFIKRDNIKNHQNQFRLSICSRKLCLDLINLGCIPAKSLILKFPTEEQVPSHLLRHFIRGYFDGDGCISSAIAGRHRNPQFCGNICGTLDFCENLNRIFQEDLGFKSTKIQKRPGMYVYFFNGNNKVRKLYNYFYKDATFFLTRKEEKMRQVLSIVAYRGSWKTYDEVHIA